MNDFKKVIRPGSIISDGTPHRIFCEIEFAQGNLSISGVVGPKANGDAVMGCGQIDMEFAHKDPKHNDPRTAYLIQPSEIKFAHGWDEEKWLRFLEIWHLWHLNDMRAGCVHQRALGWDKEGYDLHPSEPCPTCGYKYGSAWLKEDVPEDVLAFLVNLPMADAKPAWV